MPMIDFTNILVTGGAGFIGSAFLRYILQKTNFQGNVINVDALTYAGSLKSVQSIEDDDRYFFEKENICNQDQMDKICQKYNVDCIVHFAAETHVDRSIFGPSKFIQTNVLGTFSLLEVVRKSEQIHFHHISTDEVYGSLTKEDEPFNENSPYRPNSPYAASKASADHLVRSYKQTYGISASISHCCNNYGPFQFPEKFIPLMIQNCILKKPFPVYGSGENIRQWLYVEDHAEALWNMLKKGDFKSPCHIAQEEERSNLDLLYMIIDLFSSFQKEDKEKYLQLIDFVPDRPGHDFRYCLNSNSFQKRFDWKPRHYLKEGLEKTIAWHLENQSKIIA
jgi:dTDP-glucose 4,6-dehydratase